jgi:hypothetical protein
MEFMEFEESRAVSGFKFQEVVSPEGAKDNSHRHEPVELCEENVFRAPEGRMKHSGHRILNEKRVG